MRTLLLAAHNDDETLFASFLCLRHRPHVIVCYRSRVQGREYQVDFKTRESETRRASEILGFTYTQWPIFDDPDPDLDSIEAFMWGLRDPAGFEDYDLVFAPAIEKDGNEQHNVIGRLADVVFSDVTVEHYLTYTYPPLVRSRSEREVPFEPDWAFIKHKALACYASQAATPSYRHFVDDLREYLDER